VVFVSQTTLTVQVEQSASVCLYVRTITLELKVGVLVFYMLHIDITVVHCNIYLALKYPENCFFCKQHYIDENVALPLSGPSLKVKVRFQGIEVIIEKQKLGNC